MSAVSTASRWLLALFATTVLVSIGVAAAFEGHPALDPAPPAAIEPTEPGPDPDSPLPMCHPDP